MIQMLVVALLHVYVAGVIYLRAYSRGFAYGCNETRRRALGLVGKTDYPEAGEAPDDLQALSWLQAALWPAWAFLPEKQAEKLQKVTENLKKRPKFDENEVKND